ncbi:MAG TPA: SAM-dependent methyltransferase [Trebonia sp.]
MGEIGNRAALFDVSVPSITRMYDYWLGGKDNFAADRDAADQAAAIIPQLPWLVQENRRFFRRAVRYCAEAGISQFLDIGSGLPAADSVHEIARTVMPRPRVVYADIDSVAVNHSLAFLASPGTASIVGDVTRPEEILDDPEVRRLIDFGEPAAVLLLAVLELIDDRAEPFGAVATLRDALAPGSLLVISHAAISEVHMTGRTPLTDTARELAAVQRPPTGPARSRAEIEKFFDGLMLVEPGLTDVWEWRPDTRAIANPSDFLTVLGGVARK